MAGRDVLLERVVNGARNVLAETRVPANLEFAIEEAEDHIHVTLGTVEELDGLGLKPTKLSKPRKRPAKKPATPRKSTAKK